MQIFFEKKKIQQNFSQLFLFSTKFGMLNTLKNMLLTFLRNNIKIILNLLMMFYHNKIETYSVYNIIYTTKML